MRLTVESTGVTVDAVMPREALELLPRVLSEMASGNSATIVPVHAALTRSRRPILEVGSFPTARSARIGRVRAADLFRYKERDDAERRAHADELP